VAAELEELQPAAQPKAEQEGHVAQPGKALVPLQVALGSPVLTLAAASKPVAALVLAEPQLQTTQAKVALRIQVRATPKAAKAVLRTQVRGVPMQAQVAFRTQVWGEPAQAKAALRTQVRAVPVPAQTRVPGVLHPRRNRCLSTPFRSSPATAIK